MQKVDCVGKFTSTAPITHVDDQLFYFDINKANISHILLKVLAIPINSHRINKFLKISIELELELNRVGNTSLRAESFGRLPLSSKKWAPRNSVH